MIPTRDSGAFIGVFLKEYRRRGIDPLYIVDARTTDNTVEILRSNNAEYYTFNPDGDYVESGMIGYGSMKCDAKWVLRMDDDEFPSSRLMDWATNEGTKSLNQFWFIPRKELFFHEGKIFSNESPGRFSHPLNPWILNPQARLHHTERVEYLHQVHTTGFAQQDFYGFAPPDAYFIHCNALLRSPLSRLMKIRHYEAIKPLSTWAATDEYLPELFSLEDLNATAFAGEEFRLLLADLPIDQQREIPDLSEDEKIIFKKESANHFARNLTFRVHPQRFITSADDFSWARFIPRKLWRPLAEFICSIGGGRLRHWGERFYRYSEIYGGP